MKINYRRRALYHLLFSLIFGLVFILPDIIYSQINSAYPLIISPKEIVFLTALSFFLLMIRSLWIRFAFFTLFILFSLSELSHYAYFGTLISPYAIGLIISQAHDIGESFVAFIGYIYAPFVIVTMIIVPVLLFLLRYDQKLEHNTFRLRYGGVLLVVLLLLGSFKAASSKRDYLFLPRSDSYSIINFYMASSLFVARSAQTWLGFGKPQKSFAPYVVTQVNHQKPANNIIVVMGESLGYPRMSVFGFELDSTPHLKAMSDSGELIARKMIGGGVTTDVAVPSFFSLKREPENTQVLVSPLTNLFKMAKDRGYKVHYVTTQTSAILKSFIGSNADVIITKEDYEKNTMGDIVYDQVLLDYLKTVDLSKPNLIVLHQRNSHSPYESYTPKEYQYYTYNKEDFHDFNIKTYANSIRYTDALLDGMIQHLKQASSLPFLFYATSDHGELMGESGKYGHVHLLFDTAKVPFLFTHKNGDSEIVKEAKESKNGMSHYDMGKMIAHAIGYRVENPNDNSERYINGVEMRGQGGSIMFRPDTVDLDEKGKK